MNYDRNKWYAHASLSEDGEDVQRYLKLEDVSDVMIYDDGSRVEVTTRSGLRITITGVCNVRQFLNDLGFDRATRNQIKTEKAVIDRG
jgi:hypothetical protein